MPKKNLEDDWDDRVSDDLPDEEESFDEVDVSIDASGRRYLLVDPEEEHAEKVLGVLRAVLTGAEIELALDPEEAMVALVEDEYDAVVLDFKIEGFSNSELVKFLNNDPETQVVCFSLESLDASEDGTRFRLEPVKKLFEPDSKTAPKPAQ